MRKSKFTESQIVAILAEGDSGLAVGDVCRKHGISNATYYQWKSKYAGVSANELKRIKGNRPLEPKALEVEFFPMEEVLHEKVKIH
jgi:hypothetical protein